MKQSLSANEAQPRMRASRVELSRRQILAGGAAVAGGSLLWGRPAPASSPVFIWGTMVLVTAAVGALMKKLVDQEQKPQMPQLTGPIIPIVNRFDSFHGKWCDFGIDQELPRRYSAFRNASVEVSSQLIRLNRDNTDIPQYKDLNSIEVKRICVENDNNSQVFYTPCNYRLQANGGTLRMFKELCAKRTRERADEPHIAWEDLERPLDFSRRTRHTAELCYTRPMNDGRGNLYTAFMYRLRTGSRVEFRYEILT